MLEQLPAAKWDNTTAAHLLSRAGFGAIPEEVDAVKNKGLARAVNDLFEPETSASPPSWAHPQDLRTLRQEARRSRSSGDLEKVREMRQMEGKELLDLRQWWLQRMATSPAPLREKMTLFWHGHFATSAEKVRDGYWMWRQNETLRHGALGSFVTLTKAMSRDPAMMLYLDLPQSRREHPNENWARELMELFTVGIGHYEEEDVSESARAFTGYRLDLQTQQFRFAPAQHDAGPKVFLGRRGNFNGDDIIDILAQQSACAEFIAGKLCRYFVADNPTPSLVEAVAGSLRRNRFEMKPVLRELFMADEFYAPSNLSSQLKSPAQFLVQTCKLLVSDLPAAPVAQNAMRQMGQILFAPPNVKGWDGGKSWISTSTLLFRNNFADYLINGDAIIPPAAQRRGADLGFRVRNETAAIQRDPIDVSKIAPAQARTDPEKLVAELTSRFLQTTPAESELDVFRNFLAARNGDLGDATTRGLIHLILSSPIYQLT